MPKNFDFNKPIVLMLNICVWVVGFEARSEFVDFNSKAPPSLKSMNMGELECIEEIKRVAAQPPATSQNEIDHESISSRKKRPVDQSLLESLQQELTQTPANREEFAALISQEIDRRPDLRKAMDWLRTKNVPLEFEEPGKKSDCGTGAGLYYRPPMNKIVICAKGGASLSSIMDNVYHETIHALQWNQGSLLVPLTTYKWDGREIGTRSREFDMVGKYFEFEKKSSNMQSALNLELSEYRDEVHKIEQQLSEIEKFFYVDVGPAGLSFRPKQKAGLDAIGRIERPIEKTASKFILEYPQWSGAIGLSKSSKKPERLSSDFWTKTYQYLENLKSSYQKLKSKMSPSQGQKVESLFRQYYQNENRFIPHIMTFCAEMQANLDSEMRRMLFDRKLKEAGGACAKLIQPKNEKFRQIYRDSTHPPDNDEELSRIAFEIAEKSVMERYGAVFQGTEGFYAAPEIFDSRNCSNFREDLKQNGK